MDHTDFVDRAGAVVISSCFPLHSALAAPTQAAPSPALATAQKAKKVEAGGMEWVLQATDHALDLEFSRYVLTPLEESAPR